MAQILSGNRDSFNPRINVWNSFTSADNRSEILAWLSPLEPRLQHQDIRTSRVEDVGDWLLKTDQFRSWFYGASTRQDGSDSATLLCYGSPGVGKTYICSLVVDTLCDRVDREDVAVACFYFDFAVQKEQTPTHVMGSLLKQAVNGMEEIPKAIRQAFERQKRVIGGRGPRLSEIVKLFGAVSSLHRIFICLDALDECVAGNLFKILSSLSQILQKSPGARLFLTGRPYICMKVRNRISGGVATKSISPIQDDIIRYIRSRLDEDTTPGAMNRSLEADILKNIPSHVSETFLLATLNIEAVLREPTTYRRRQVLRQITDDLSLEDAYGATLGRIQGQGGEKSRLGIAALMWICHAGLPIKPDQLCHALAVEDGSTGLNTDNVPSISTLLICCQGLVVMDHKSSPARLIHLTLRQYLCTRGESFTSAHWEPIIKQTCLNYLDSQPIMDLLDNHASDLDSLPFLNFAISYAGIWAKKRNQLTDQSLAAWFCAYCGFGPMNRELDPACIECGSLAGH
ncbi:hypothetical protein L873DRAFT_1791626 [Choiromyces venosus 120613-1]|uniref:Nephrocystin 3-like N-terminal domain-containing protein n=1 Tax=Choiromyces venosus 120613-1 TaxID=1336337 RepID=A0A3N4JID8_9PEZI|nr:hypothetical protein L873DRAFT_1791626 [Choiromyces venosus 120613-1]